MENKHPEQRKRRSKAASDYNTVRATKRYRAGVEKKVESGEADRAADKARRAVEGPEASELDRAVDEAKSGPKSVREPEERAIERGEGEGMGTARSDSDVSPAVEDVERDNSRR